MFCFCLDFAFENGGKFKLDLYVIPGQGPEIMVTFHNLFRFSVSFGKQRDQSQEPEPDRQGNQHSVIKSNIVLKNIN